MAPTRTLPGEPSPTLVRAITRLARPLVAQGQVVVCLGGLVGHLEVPLPSGQRKIGADPGGFAERQCQGLHKSLLQHETRTENRLVH